jgi:predicted esterase
MFIPGGSTGSKRAAGRVWDNYLSAGQGVDGFRLVIPYAEDFDLIDDTDRLVDIVTEVLTCHGGDPASFHIAGYSHGGQIAFSLMLRRPEFFSTLLGAPGEFRINDVDRFRENLAGKAVFNGVGAEDVEWIPSVKATHDALVEAGIESMYVEFAGEDHRLSAEFDESIFFEFWIGH